MGMLLRILGSSLFKYALVALLGGGLVIAFLKVYWHYTDILTKANKYDQVVLEMQQLRDANAGLVRKLDEQQKAHDAEIARLNADRVALDNERKAIQKRAFVEAGKLKKALQESQDANNWYQSVLPTTIQRLFHESIAPEGAGLHPHGGIPESTARGQDP